MLGKRLPTIETPVQIITGDHDPGVLPVNGEYLHKWLPHSKSDKVDAGHFAWADAADEYATLIIDWWNIQIHNRLSAEAIRRLKEEK